MIASGKEYHQHTSYDRRSLGGHFLDWSNQPNVYKEYPEIEPTALPREVSRPEGKLSEVLERTGAPEEMGSLSAELLSSILGTAYTLTARARRPGGDVFFRSVPSAGALYPFELYLAAGSVDGLEDGLYHFSIARHALSRLRRGHPADFGLVPKDLKDEDAPHLTFFATAIYFRSAWKYRDRSYRYHLMDTGHLLENLALSLRALGLPYEVSYDFEDERVNVFLGVDPRREVCLALMHVSSPASEAFVSPDFETPLPESVQGASRVSPKEVDYPVLGEIHSSGSRVEQAPASGLGMALRLGPSPDAWQPLPPMNRRPEKLGFADAVLRRRSLRNFVPKTLGRDQFDALLSMLRLDDANGAAGRIRDHSVCPGFLAGNVEGVEPGCYLVDPAAGTFALAGRGAQIEEMTRICLDQEWLSQCALHVFVAANLDALEEAWGPRGYRYAMMTAGRLGERMYLGATALGLGCCGIGAFYDREAATLLGLNESSRMLYLLGVGPVKKVF